MKPIVAMLSAAVALAPALAIPTFASAQYYHGSNDPCWHEKREAGTAGAISGGALGAVLGGSVAGRHDRVGGALVGGALGAVAGHEIGRSAVRCGAYPNGYHRHRDCHWVEQDQYGRRRGYEICRMPNGEWGPYRGY